MPPDPRAHILRPLRSHEPAPKLEPWEELRQELQGVLDKMFPEEQATATLYRIQRARIPLWDRGHSSSVELRVNLDGDSNTPENWARLREPENEIADFTERLAYHSLAREVDLSLTLASPEYDEDQALLEENSLEVGRAVEAGIDGAEIVDELAPRQTEAEEHAHAATIDDIERVAARVDERLRQALEPEQRVEHSADLDQGID